VRFHAEDGSIASHASPVVVGASRLAAREVGMDRLPSAPGLEQELRRLESYHLVVDKVGCLSERRPLVVAEVRPWLGGSTP
jgi:hypothetical protein